MFKKYLLNWRDSSEVSSTVVAPEKPGNKKDSKRATLIAGEGELKEISWVNRGEGAHGKREGVGGENKIELDGQGGEGQRRRTLDRENHYGLMEKPGAGKFPKIHKEEPS